ncbi:unnamed protein product [Acanthoscelides obtectus]|uniref:Uncharacterized protein n=1 Tax=Acanthoscelides obtectus TaxID=200917 RepID=A0A9P0LJ56_ACAOB|nr:unnamed protein product [Acanthoscelides obtectus]CAK1622429.1 hypothetical protein AOBTE_LOCUS1474 [Acanthoscelides obtectus]
MDLPCEGENALPHFRDVAEIVDSSLTASPSKINDQLIDVDNGLLDSLGTEKGEEIHDIDHSPETHFQTYEKLKIQKWISTILSHPVMTPMQTQTMFRMNRQNLLPPSYQISESPKQRSPEKEKWM